MAAEVNRHDYAAETAANPSTANRLANEAAPGAGQSVQPEAAQGAAELADSAEAGAAVHAFNPDEDPAVKAARAKQEAKAALQPVDGAKVGRTNKGSGPFYSRILCVMPQHKRLASVQCTRQANSLMVVQR